MHRPDIRNGRVPTDTAGWISIQINDADGLPSHRSGGALEEAKTDPPALIHLFDHVEEEPLSLPERFPRLTVLAIAIVLLVTALTAEFDYLRQAGYFWQ